jgi:sialidase-1
MITRSASLCAFGYWAVVLMGGVAQATASSPVAHWSFDEASPNPGQVAHNILARTPHDLHAFLHRAQIVESGLWGRGVLVEEAGSYVRIPRSESLLAGERWGVSLWFRLKAPHTDDQRVLMASGGAMEGISLVITHEQDADRLLFRIGEVSRQVDTPLGLGWHHVAFSRSGDKAAGWLDGKLVALMPAATVETDDVRFGMDRGLNESRRLRGFLDEIKVYPNALDDAAVNALHREHPQPPMVSAPFESGNYGGDERYALFRIPSLLTAADGTVLAFAEGRVNSGADFGDIDLVLRRSHDNGRTWDPLQVVWDDAENTCGNPTPVLDRTTGRIWLAMTHNPGPDSQFAIMGGDARGTRTVWMAHSDDHGDTWSPPEEITDQVKHPDWKWYATGPGVGIQLRDGRLLIPAYRNTGHGVKTAYAHTIISDDHGASWRVGGEAGDEVSESQVAELQDGSVLLSMRRTGNRPFSRVHAISRDRGETWSDPAHQPQLVASGGMQGSVLRYSFADGQQRSRLIYSDPANYFPFNWPNANGRLKMTVRVSYDEGATWAHSRELFSGWSAYSCLTQLDDGTIGILYEWGDENRYEKLVFERFTLEWLTEGKDGRQRIKDEG